MENNCKISRWELLKSQLNNLNPRAFQKMMNEEDIVLIDCRKPEEIVEGKLKGAINLNYLGLDFLDQMERLDIQGKFLVYCRSGRRSIRTCTLMQNGGFTQVFNLDGGLNAWIPEFGETGLIVSETKPC